MTPGPLHQEKATAVASPRRPMRIDSGEARPAMNLLRMIEAEEIGEERSMSSFRPSFSGAKSEAPLTTARIEKRAPRKQKVPRFSPFLNSQHSTMKMTA